MAWRREVHLHLGNLLPLAPATGALGLGSAPTGPALGNQAAGGAAAGVAPRGRCRRVTLAPGVANRKRKSRAPGAFPLIRFTR